MVIGLLGGMGSYATLHFFERYLSKFPADKEWERPRIVIDNRCTMPSRVKAIIEGTGKKQLISDMTESIKWLDHIGCSHIVLACNTSHYFLPYVYDNIPEVKPKVLNIIDLLAKFIFNKLGTGVPISLIATEGTILSGIYQDYFSRYGLSLQIPSEKVFSQLRYFIEAVKTNNISDKVLYEFSEFLAEQPSENIILGCTEFPVLFDRIRDDKTIGSLHIYDPLETTLDYLRNAFLNDR